MEENESKISNTEWGLLIAALFCIDLIQVLIDIFLVWVMGINVFINFLIDMMVGMSLPLYLQLRGESMANPKRIFSILATFGLEMIPLVSDLPLWGLDGLFLMSISKGDKMIKKSVIGGAVVGFVPKATRGMKFVAGSDKKDLDKAA